MSGVGSAAFAFGLLTDEEREEIERTVREMVYRLARLDSRVRRAFGRRACRIVFGTDEPPPPRYRPMDYLFGDEEGGGS